MAKHVVLKDDIDGTTDKPVKTYHFALDGHHYEIDLHEVHYEQLRDSLGRFISKATKVTPTHTVARRAPRGTARRVVNADRERLTAIRTWARAHGHTVADRGRIPETIIAAYDAAH